VNRAIRIAVFVFAITGIAAIAQTKELTPKDTAASQVLAQLAKDHAADQTDRVFAKGAAGRSKQGQEVQT
jgi:hypothetical protein